VGFGVWGLGFGVWGMGFGIWGFGYGIEHARVDSLNISRLRMDASW